MVLKKKTPLSHIVVCSSVLLMRQADILDISEYFHLINILCLPSAGVTSS